MPGKATKNSRKSPGEKAKKWREILSLIVALPYKETLLHVILHKTFVFPILDSGNVDL